MTQYDKRLKEIKEEQKYVEELADMDWGQMAQLSKQLKKEGDYVDAVTKLDVEQMRN